MKVEIDSFGLCIIDKDNNIQVNISNIYEMMSALNILLTVRQHDLFSSDVTIDFIVGEKRWKDMIYYVTKDPENYWINDKHSYRLLNEHLN